MTHSHSPHSGELNVGIDGVLTMLKRAQIEDALNSVEKLVLQGQVIRDLEYVHALCLLQFDRKVEAVSALQKEVENFPGNAAAARLLGDLEEEIGASPRPYPVAPQTVLVESLTPALDLAVEDLIRTINLYFGNEFEALPMGEADAAGGESSPNATFRLYLDYKQSHTDLISLKGLSQQRTGVWLVSNRIGDLVSHTNCPNTFLFELPLGTSVYFRDYKLPRTMDVAMSCRGDASENPIASQVLEQLKLEVFDSRVLASADSCYIRTRNYSNVRVFVDLPELDNSADEVFNVIACGALVMLPAVDSRFQYLPFVPGQHLVTFESWDDLREKIRFYLQREDLRCKIASAGQKLATEVLRKDLLVERLFKALRKIKEAA